ncbi:upstream activation factor subunit spp27-like isoform X1 [Papaver somniferum]|uniref:upstream activation factor subunit spp27-like isoform X1 n=1 Tax=Papaver somniferum TaxID=3469 RepID=UPI000E6FDD91|nr:upstream activation factor subunit spp27-like isoform X1 [Papaver somniferum]
MVQDSELVERLREFLSVSDLNTTTTGIVRRKLEEDFGVDLSEKKAFIREQVDLYLQTQVEKNDDEEEEEEEVDEEEEEEEEEPERRTSSRNGGTRKKKKVSKKANDGEKKRGGGGGGGFNKVCSLSPELQKIIGVPEMARTEVVKQLWAYIREKDLQDPKNTWEILCDESLRDLFRVDSINMFQMNKVLSKHIWPLESDEATITPVKTEIKEQKRKQDKTEASVTPVKTEKKEKKRKQDKTEGSDDSQPKDKRQKLGFHAPLKLSDALVKFLGTGETSLSRAEVTKKMWEYIKLNNLQDPSDKRQIICDDKLKELFNLETFTGFTVAKHLAVHFVKSEQ